MVNILKAQGGCLWALYKHFQGFKLAISNHEDVALSADGLSPSLPLLGVWYFLRHVLP